VALQQQRTHSFNTGQFFSRTTDFIETQKDSVFSVTPVSVKTPAGVHSETPAPVSGVQDPDFGDQSGQLFGFFWIGYRFPFNCIRVIQIK